MGNSCISKDDMLEDMIYLFESSNNSFIKDDLELFESQVSERTLCGALMLHLHEALKKSKYSEYNVDVEYNRNKDDKLKSVVKTIQGIDEKIIRISCDLIVHSRAKNLKQDNLIAIEMKKSENKDKIEEDKERLICLTRDSFNGDWSFNGKELPKHVCRYKLGVYYEINYPKRKILIEYYKQGECFKTYEMLF